MKTLAQAERGQQTRHGGLARGPKPSRACGVGRSPWRVVHAEYMGVGHSNRMLMVGNGFSILELLRSTGIL